MVLVQVSDFQPLLYVIIIGKILAEIDRKDSGGRESSALEKGVMHGS